MSKMQIQNIIKSLHKHAIMVLQKQIKSKYNIAKKSIFIIISVLLMSKYSQVPYASLPTLQSAPLFFSFVTK